MTTLVGSNNYNLNTESSDKDYKLFVVPTFEDLYAGELFSTPNIITPDVDYDIHDIRQLPQLLWKANINYMETLYSISINFTCFNSAPSELFQLIALRDTLMRMNIPKFYASCLGTHRQKMLLLHKGTESTQTLVDKFGYDTKQACHAIRVLDAAERFHDTDFKDFKLSIWYDNADPMRKVLLDIKGGEYTEKEFVELATEKAAKMSTLAADFDKFEADKYTLEMANNLIKNFVKKYM